MIFFFIENGEPPPFASHPALTAALQNGPDGDGSVLSGAKALESCAYLAQSMLAHNFRDPSGLDPNSGPGSGRFIPPDSESSQELPPSHLHTQIPTPGYTTPSYLNLTNDEGINTQPHSEPNFPTKMPFFRSITFTSKNKINIFGKFSEIKGPKTP